MKYALLIGGQGNYNPEMFEIIKKNEASAKYLNIAAEYLNLSLNDITELLQNDNLENKYSQPLLSTYSYAIWQSIKDNVPPPTVAAGFSLGELVAYACADSFSFETLLELSVARAKYMDTASPKNIEVLAVMGLKYQIAEQLLSKKNCYMMIISSSSHFTACGDKIDILELKNTLRKDYYNVEIRDVALKLPSHTPLLASAAKLFSEKLDRINFNNPKFPIFAGINGRLIKNKNIAKQTLSKQICQTIRWDKCYSNAVERGAEIFLEISPSAILTKMIHRENKRLKANSSSAFNTLKGIGKWINKSIMC
jgi:[acyl-carrier-protein] S-malonyltransferase